MLYKCLFFFLLVAVLLQRSLCQHQQCHDDVCDRPLVEPGRCRGYFERFGYDGKCCRKFYWGGCDNNGNNFDDLKQCQAACGKASCFNVCDRPLVEPGRCTAIIERYGYDGKCCRKFYWGGCDDNGNNFDDLKQCQATCGTTSCYNVCDRPLVEPGRCKARIERYGYDGKCCRKFYWGGCDDNGNNFKDIEKCQAACGTSCC